MHKPNVFVAVYVGDSIANSKIVAASADPRIVGYVAAELLHEPRFTSLQSDDFSDPIGDERRRVLRLVETGGSKQ